MNEHLTPRTYTKDIINRLAKEFNDPSLEQVKNEPSKPNELEEVRL